MWPISFKVARKKMRQYRGKKKQPVKDDDNDDTEPTLP
jgi:hypothetical protein